MSELSEKTKLPLSVIGSCAVILVLIVLYVASAKGTADEALKIANETKGDQKQIIIMYGEIQRSIGKIEGKLEK